MSRSCTACPGRITSGSTTGLCKPCSYARRFPDAPRGPRFCTCGAPVSRGSSSGLCRPCSLVARYRDPDYRKRWSAGVRQRYARMSVDQRRAQARRAWEASRSARIAWCPLEYRPLYQQLMRNTGPDRLTLAEAKQLIFAQMEIDARRYQRTGQLQAHRHG